jgi:DNA-binding HxlR family transcriptional regulator
MAANPLDRQKELMELLGQETRHSIVQSLLGHPHHLASAAEIDYMVADKSTATVDEQLDVLVDAGVVARYEYPPNKSTRGLPWVFYGFTPTSIPVLEDFNYLSGVPMARAVHQKTKKTEKIIRHEEAPRPPLPTPVREAFKVD